MEFDELAFDTETQLNFIMKNIFGNPPILEFSNRVVVSEELFPNEILDEAKVKGVICID